MKLLFTNAVLLSLTFPLFAQVLSPPSNSGPRRSSSNNSNHNQSSTSQQQGSPDSVHGMEMPIIDPTAKTYTFQGRTYSLTDNNLGGQFEAYLASSEYLSEDAKQYRANIKQILDLLSPLNPGGPDLRAAYTMLEKTSEYSGDGAICSSLANSIYAGRLTMNGIGNKKDAIAKLKKEQRRLIYNSKVLENKGELGSTKTVASQGSTTTTKLNSSTEYQAMKKRITEIDATIKKFEASGVIDLTQSKIQYQAMMVQLFIQRRFQHVVMAARFYNIIYKDGDQKLRIKRGSDADKFFSEGLGVNPTVAGLDSAANEAIRKSQTLIEAFNNNLESERLHAASERLAEAFIIGEFMPSVQTVAQAGKERVQQYIQNANNLIEALDVKNLGIASKLNQSLKKQATDYNASKADSFIAAHKRISDGFVRDAKFALRQEKIDQVKASIGKAVKHWPSNPEIEKFNKMLDTMLLQGFEEQDLTSQTIKEFDRLISDKNYRAVIEEPRKSKFVVVFGKLNDSERLKQLEEIGNSITEIEKALEKSDYLVAKGHPYAAWEAIYSTQNKYSDDPKIADAKAKLSGEVSDFSKALNQAKKLENAPSPQTGSALSWYLRAQVLYPDSNFAKEGIKRILNKQFKKQH